MNKKLLTLAVAAAMVSPLAVQAAGSGPTVYGVAHVAVENVDNEITADGGSRSDDLWRVNSRQSLFGIKGEEDLGNGLSAIYKMEFQVDLDGNNAMHTTTSAAVGYGLQDTGAGWLGGSGITARNQYVGLSHKGFGTLLMGRHDNPIKMMTISRDQFNTTLGDWNEVQAQTGVDNMGGANRDTDVILYKSPNFSGFEAVAMVSPGETSTADGIADGVTSIGGRYVNGPIYIGAGWEERDFDSGVNGWDEEESWRAAASYDIAGFRVSGMYHDTESVGMGVNNNVDAETWQLALSYKIGNTVVKGMWQEGEQDNAAGVKDDEYEAFALGVDHHFSKRTKVYAVYTETEDKGAKLNTTDGVNLKNTDVQAFGAGIIHKF